MGHMCRGVLWSMCGSLVSSMCSGVVWSMCSGVECPGRTYKAAIRRRYHKQPSTKQRV